MQNFGKLVAITLFILMALNALACAEEVIPEGEELGIIKGMVVSEDGKPFTPGFVAFFSSAGLSPMDYGTTRRSPKMIAFLDDTGSFTTHVMPSGPYFIGAMQRTRWRGGPPARGEKRYSAFTKTGEYLTVELKKGATLDIGTIMVKEPEKAPELKEFFTIKGRLLDEKGKGVFDSVVVVKENYNDPKAQFISEKSAINGAYELKLPPGKYFLLARETVAGSTRPKPGSVYGELGQYEPVGVGGKVSRTPSYISGKAGEVYDNVDITMFKVPIPEVKRKETEEMVRTNKLDKENLPENLPLRKQKNTTAVRSSLKPATKAERQPTNKVPEKE